MRIHEILKETPTTPAPVTVGFSDKFQQQQAKTANVSSTQTVKNAVDLKGILGKISQGDWKGAIMAGALGLVPQLKDSLTGAQFDMLKHAADTQGAADFLGGLAKYASSRGLPWLAGATAPVAGLVGGLTYSGNAGDPAEDEFFKHQRWRREAEEFKQQQANLQAAVAAQTRQQQIKRQPKHSVK
jgi:hypothetical protein